MAILNTLYKGFKIFLIFMATISSITLCIILCLSYPVWLNYLCVSCILSSAGLYYVYHLQQDCIKYIVLRKTAFCILFSPSACFQYLGQPVCVLDNLMAYHQTLHNQVKSCNVVKYCQELLDISKYFKAYRTAIFCLRYPEIQLIKPYRTILSSIVKFSEE